MIYVSDKFVSEPIASVFIFTYNQEGYIAETIESILNQKTSFKYEIILVDDCSTDNTKNICLSYQNKYPKKIKFIANTINKGLIKSYHESIKKYCNSKYIAQCAGDDFWISDDKLEQQINILETNNSIGLVHTQMKKLNAKTNKKIISELDRNLTSFNELLYNNCIAAPTVCFRKKLYLNYLFDIKPLTHSWIVEDTPMWLWFSINSKIYLIDKPMVMYRIIAGSISNTNSSKKRLEFIQSRLSIKLFFIDKYGATDDIKTFVLEDFYKDAEYHALKLKEKDIIDTIAKKYKSNKSFLKSTYFHIMSKLIKYNFIYTSLFLGYRISNKIKTSI